MKIRDLMTRPPVTIRDIDDVGLALQVMAWGDIRHLPVVREERLLGVVSERDLLANRQANPRIADIMTAPAQVTGPDDDVSDAARRMVGARLGCLPVVDRGKLVGIVTMTDLVAMHGAQLAPPDPAIAVSSTMTREPVTVSPDDFLLDAIRRIAARQVRHAPVVDAQRRVVGMLSDRDIRLALGASLLSVTDGAAGPRVRLLKVREAMSADPVVARESTPLREAAAAFLHKNVGALPVVDGQGRIVGIISYVDVLRALIENRGGRSTSNRAV